jgi:hypothetical protein
MTGMSIKKVQTDVLLLSTASAVLAVLFVIFDQRFSPATIIFLVMCFILVSLHWWLLGNLVNSIFSGDKFISIIIALFAFFPLALSIALCFIAGKINRSYMIPAGLGVLTVPASVTAYCLFKGIAGQLRFFRIKGSMYGTHS